MLCARATVQRVVAIGGGDPVVAIVSVENVADVAAEQGVVAVAPHHGHGSALHVGATDGEVVAGAEIDRVVTGTVELFTVSLIDGVDAGAAQQHIVATSVEGPADRVVAAGAIDVVIAASLARIDRVGVPVTGQAVRESGPDDVLDVRLDRVARADGAIVVVAVVGETVAQCHRHARTAQ